MLTAIGDYQSRTATNSDSAKLLGACFGAEEFLSEISSIFDHLFSITVLGQKNPPPSDPLLRQIYDRAPEYWHEHHFKEALARLPLAIRALRRVFSPEQTRKILQIIKQQFTLITSEASKIGLSTNKESLELFTESLNTFIETVCSQGDMRILEDFLGSTILKDLLDFTTNKDGSQVQKEYRSAVVFSLIHFCERVPQQYVERFFVVLTHQCTKTVDRVSSGEDLNLEGICKMVVSLCRRTNTDCVTELLSNLELSYSRCSEKCCDLIPVIIKAIKVVKGRRFLAKTPSTA